MPAELYLVDTSVWLQVLPPGNEAEALRRRGVTVPFTDLLVAAVAAGAEAVLVHRDRHFDSIAAHVGLKVESHV